MALRKSRVKLLQISVVLLILSATVATFSIGVAASGGVSPPSPLPPEILPSSAVSRPALSGDDVRATMLAINDHQPLANALEGIKFDVSKIGPWTSNDMKLGASMFITLHEPLNATLSWPYINYQRVQDGAAVYDKLSYTADVTGLYEVHVVVDLATKEVVVLEPVKFSTLTLQDPT